jgi:dihydropyrimidinase
MQQAAKLGVMVDVHAEEGDVITFLEDQLLKAGKKSLSFFPQSRPNFVEETVVHDLIRFNAYLKGKLYFVHLSTGESVETLNQAQDLKGKAFGETCPQYLLLTDSCYGLDNGEQYAIVPPLRHAEDQKRLWQAIKEGVIQVVGTDHCPFMSQYKQGKSDFTQVPKGIFGMFPRKGAIAVNSDADLVIFNPGEKWQVSTDKLVSRADFSPYDSFKLTGKVETTISRGEVVYRDGKILGKAGRGQFIFRRL